MGAGEVKSLLTSGQVKAEILEELSWWKHTRTEGEGDGYMINRKRICSAMRIASTEKVNPGEEMCWQELIESR